MLCWFHTIRTEMNAPTNYVLQQVKWVIRSSKNIKSNVQVCFCTWLITGWSIGTIVNTLRPRQNGRYFPDDIFECIFLKENVLIPIKISLKLVPKSPINNIPELVQIMAWSRPGDKPLSEPMLVRLPTHICVTRPQWVKPFCYKCASYLLELMLFVNVDTQKKEKDCKLSRNDHVNTKR